jgi:hypothetical protein
VKQQAASCAQQLWLDGVQHYQEYVADLLEEFKDIVGEGEWRLLRVRYSEKTGFNLSAADLKL